MHGLQACLLKYITVAAFMLSVVKMPLKGKVEGHALNIHGNYIVDHGKIMELYFLISVGTLTDGLEHHYNFTLENIFFIFTYSFQLNSFKKYIQFLVCSWKHEPIFPELLQSK